MIGEAFEARRPFRGAVRRPVASRRQSELGPRRRMFFLTKVVKPKCETSSFSSFRSMWEKERRVSAPCESDVMSLGVDRCSVSLAIWVGDERFEVGTASFLKAWFSTIYVRLEQEY